MCSVDGCPKPSFCRGWCSMHYSRWQRHGDPGSAESTHYRGSASCAVDGCTSPVRGRNLCGFHYQRWRKRGHTDDPRPTVDARFWAKVDKTDTCWIWTGAMGPGGYGRFNFGGRATPAYRVSYELLVGLIPEGLELDHLCRVPACVNPDHLEPVTHEENMRRSKRATRTHCKHGHEFTDENTRLRKDGSRVCRTCDRALQAASYQRRKARNGESTAA